MIQKKDWKQATSADIASALCQQKSAVQAIQDGLGDDNFASGIALTAAPATSARALVDTKAPSAKAKAKAKPKAGAGATGHAQPLDDPQSAAAQVAKILRAVKDPVVAATKFRKQTLKMLNTVAAKLEASKLECTNALDELHDDFDCEVGIVKRKNNQLGFNFT